MTVQQAIDRMKTMKPDAPIIDNFRDQLTEITETEDGEVIMYFVPDEIAAEITSAAPQSSPPPP